ncbi:MAG: cadmium-translocating P-type ATPase [Oscillospiraceae bacterium]|nr:cadmium-translocating P-type ATPase [Oscillospiraceae bacterium]
MATKIYTIAHLDCANCAAKMEAKIRALPSVEAAAIVFATKQLRLTAPEPEALLPQIQKIISSIEPEAQISHTPPEHCHQEHCHCGHDHHTEHSEHSEGLLIGLGTGLFAAGLLFQWLSFSLISRLIFIGAYLILGFEILKNALWGIIRGHVFDENFLMSVATIGAFCINEFPEAVGVMLFYRVGEFFEHRAVEKSRRQIMEAIDLRPETVTLQDGTVIPAGEAQVGDLLLVRPGDRIPLDGTVISGESRIDTAPITGEPVPIRVVPGDNVTSGCVNTVGQLILRVDKPLSGSMVTKILEIVEEAAAGKPKLDRFITRFAKVYTPIVVLTAAVTAIVPSLITGNWNYWVYTALSFLVMSCPCALVLSVPLAFFSGIGIGSKQGILFKGGAALETLAGIKAVVMDKTGTVTKGDFTVQDPNQALLALCASCEQFSTHPIAESIVAASGMALQKPEKLEELPGHGIVAILDGAQILCGNEKLMAKYGVDLSNHQSAPGGTQVIVAKNREYLGCILINDTIKADAADAVAKVKAMGIHTAMLTGDREESARYVADAVGIQDVHAQLLPQEKLAQLQSIRAGFGPVMFVGDGINDAPVLSGADVGAAMGSGADAAIEAADVVFLSSQTAAIPEALSIARRTWKIALQNVIFALGIKAIVMILGLLGLASMWAAVFADSGVAMLCVLNAIRILYEK